MSADTNVYYEKEGFTNNRVPIRIFFHDYKDSRMFTVIHWHRSLEINLTLAGEVTHVIDGVQQVCGPGQMCIVNSGELHLNYSSSDMMHTQMITLQIAIPFLTDWFGEDAVFSLPGEAYVTKQIIRVITSIADESRSTEEYHELRQMNNLYSLLVLLSKGCRKTDSERRAQGDGLRRFKEVLDYIEVNYREDLSLEGIAKQFGYAPAYLSRSFKKHIGYNFSTHLQMIRLNAAVMDMRNDPAKSILDCSADHGFPNVKALIHVFKREYGMTPSEWRKAHAGMPEASTSVYIDSIPLEFADAKDNYLAMRNE